MLVIACLAYPLTAHLLRPHPPEASSGMPFCSVEAEHTRWRRAAPARTGERAGRRQGVLGTFAPECPPGGHPGNIWPGKKHVDQAFACLCMRGRGRKLVAIQTEARYAVLSPTLGRLPSQDDCSSPSSRHVAAGREHDRVIARNVGRDFVFALSQPSQCLDPDRMTLLARLHRGVPVRR